MALNFGPIVNTQLLELAGLSVATHDASTFEIVSIDPSSPTTVVRCTTTATIPTADLIGALIAYFSPPGSTSATAAVSIHGDGTVTAAEYAAAHTWAALTAAGVELSGGAYARQPLTWTVVGSTATASVSFNVPTETTVDGFAYETAQTAGTASTPLTVAPQPFPTGGIYTVVLTFHEE